MKNRTIAIAILLLLITGGTLLFTDLPIIKPTEDSPSKATAQLSLENKDQGPASLGDFHINHSKKIGNLELFLVEGKEQLGHKEYVSLADAMEKGYVVVHETSNVNELSISNKSDYFIYVNSGDIVEGGKQDRTIQDDVIVGPNTRRQDLASFCVESGRWAKRGDENVGTFAAANYCLTSKDLKVAARYRKNQGRVWNKVEQNNTRLNVGLSSKIGSDYDVRYEDSPTSLQKALEDTLLQSQVDELKKDFLDLIDLSEDEVGFAYAINGELYAVELFNNEALLNDLWNKLITSVVTEAIASGELEEQGDVSPMDVLKAIETGESDIKTKKLNKHTKLKEYQFNDKSKVSFRTIDAQENAWLHYSVLTLDEEDNEKDEDEIIQERNSLNNILRY